MKRSITIILCILSLQVIASNPKSGDWNITPSYSKAFIENKSQFNGRNKLENTTILFAMDHGPYQVYFTKSGLTYRLDKKLPRKKWDKTKPLSGEDEWMKIMSMRRQVNMQSDIIHMNWLNANKNVEVIASDETSEYFSYSMGSNSLNPNHVRGFKKLVYKNLYLGIDAVYEFHPEQGFKYSFIIHPGADPSLIQMKYSEDAKLIKDDEGNLLISTQFGNITDHAPVSYYDKNKSGKINSSFEIQNNIISFNLGVFNNNKTIIIDPWTIFPPSPNSNKVWEVETDNAGNVYAFMGDMPMTLRKYNSTGAIQWTYLTAWDSAGFWIGGMITHPSGDSYITSGSNGEIRKISTAGSQVWYNNPNSLTSYEYWSLGFNCDLTRLVIGGTRLTFSIPFPILRGIVTEVNLNSGAQITTTVVGYGNVIGIPPDVQEVSSLSSAPNGNYYFLTLDSVGSISNDLSTINFKTATTYNFDYYIPGYGFGTKQPISAIRATNACFYTHNGVLIDKRDLTSGAIINSASIPGGISNTTFFGTNVQGNGGLDIDSCGNVYVGSGNGVHKYDANLNLISSATTPGAVYDVDVSNNGEVAFSGSSFVGAVFLSSCNVPIQICSTTLIAAASATDILCNGDCNGTASANAIGGTSPFTYSWNTGDTTQVVNNLCPGTYTVIITDSLLLADTATVTITEPLPISSNTSSTNATCGSNNGTATVSASGGTGPFTFIWAPIGGTDSIATGLVSGTYVVIISDANGCSTTDTVNVSSTNGPQVSIASQIDPLCFGASNGTATATATAGTPPYSYSWTTSPVQTTPTATGLSAGTYTVTVTDTLGCITTQQVTIGEPDSISISISLISNDECGLGNGSALATGGGGTPGFSYSWNTTPAQTTPQAINLNFGSYIVTVTDTLGCTETQNVLIPEIPSPVATLSGQINVSCPGDSTGSATFSVSSGTIPYTYAWSTNPVQTTPTATGLPAGSYTITVTDQTGCTTTQTVNITAASSLAATSTSTPTSCGLSNGTASVNVTGGTPGYIYNWSTSPGQSGQTATGLSAGTYTVTVTDLAGCSMVHQVVVSAIPDLTSSAISNPVCGAGNGSATVSVTGGTIPYTYLWSPSGGNSPTATGLNDGVYTCSITDANGCTSAISVTVVVYPDVMANAGQDITIEPGNNTQLTATGGTSYSWTPTTGLSCASCQSPVANPEATTTYCVIVTDDNGCTATACVKVSVVENCGEVFVPDAFSPDGSSNPENEKQCVYGRCIATMEFSIYTRWGERVFSTTELKKCWDGTYKGKQMNTGVYVYYLKATLTDGTNINKQGDISLIR